MTLPLTPFSISQRSHKRACRYYQSNPNALVPFTPNPDIHDPDFASSCDGKDGNCEVGWGLRVVDSTGLSVYGAGLYSFFDNYDACEFRVSPKPVPERASTRSPVTNYIIH